jgi:hypothetical protein
MHGAPEKKTVAVPGASSSYPSFISELHKKCESLEVNCARNMRVNGTMNARWGILVATLMLLREAAVASGAFLDKDSDFKGQEVIGEGAVFASSLRRLSGTTPFSGRVSAWELIDTSTNTKVMDLFTGAIVYSTNPSFSIKAVVSGSGTRSVSLALNGVYTNTENKAPYALCKNSGQIFIRCDKLTHGLHTVTGQACPDRDARGNCQQPPSALVFEIRLPNAPTAKSPTSAPVQPPAKPPTNSPNTPPMKAPAMPQNAPIKATPSAPALARSPTKQPFSKLTSAPVCTLRDSAGTCCQPGATLRDGKCCQSGDILVKSPVNTERFCCPAGVTLVEPLGTCCQPGATLLDGNRECCPPGSTQLNRNLDCCDPGSVLLSGVCCPPGTSLIGSDGKCCQSGDILVKSPVNTERFCCPAGVTLVEPLGTCCQPGATLLDGSRECCPPGSTQLNRNLDCCLPGVNVVGSDGTCCKPGDVLAGRPFSSQRFCCPAGVTLVDINGKCCLAGVASLDVFGLCCGDRQVGC